MSQQSQSENKIDQSQDKSLEIGFKLDEMPKFQNLPIKEYYDKEMFLLIQQGLREIAIQKPEDAIMFLGQYLLKNSKQK